MFLAAPHKRKAETASLDDDDLLASIMKAKGLDADDDDAPVARATPPASSAKRQKSEVTLKMPDNHWYLIYIIASGG